MIPFSPPYINDKVIAEVVDSLKSGWITTGPKVKKLEEEISGYIDVPDVVCVNSWTSAAIMILRWLELKPGDEVIIPAYTYSATALAVIHAGGTPVMVDVGDDFNMDMELVRELITSNTKAIMPVDFAGYPCNYELLSQIIKEKAVADLYQANSEVQRKLGRIMVVADAAHSLGARYRGKMMGHEADITIFSLHAVKNITTAEGGAIALNMPAPFDNGELYKTLRMMSLNFQTKDALHKTKLGGWRYDIIGLGLKINLPDVNAAIGLAQIREYPRLLIKRIELFERYQKGFESVEWAMSPPKDSELANSSCHLFPLRIKNITEEQRDQIIEEITAAKVAVNVHFVPLPMLTFFKSIGFRIDDYPKAYQNYACEISLPIYPQLTNEQIDFIVKVTIEAYHRVVG